MVTLCCAIVRVPGSAFPVDIDEDKLVGHLKEEIKKMNPATVMCDANELKIFLARRHDGKWMREDDAAVPDLEAGRIHPNVQNLLGVGNLSSMTAIGEVLEENNMIWGGAPRSKQIHILVELPEANGAWNEATLSTLHPDVRSSMWSSVLRISSSFVFSATALVVGRTKERVYLLANLHVWIDDENTFVEYLSPDFQNQLKRYIRANPKKKTSAARTRSADDALGTRKSPRAIKQAKLSTDLPQVVLERLLPDATAFGDVDAFSLTRDICWRSSADRDFAIFELPLTPMLRQLAPCGMSLELHPTMKVHVFGFPGVLQARGFDHSYAIIPAEITGWSGLKMTLSSLSAPGLSGGAIVCTKRGVPVGFVGGGLDGSNENEQYQSYGFTFHTLPPDLPSSLRSDAEGGYDG